VTWRKGLLPRHVPTYFDRYFLLEEHSTEELIRQGGKG